MLTRLLVAAGLSIPTISVANVVGTDLQNFNAATDGIDFVTVHASEALDVGLINIGLMTNYAVNSLPYFDSGSSQSRLKPNDKLWSSELLIGAGLFPRVDFGIGIAYLLKQEISDNDSPRGQFSNPGFTNWRANVKGQIFKGEKLGMALAFSTTFNNIKRNPYLGKNQSPIYNIEAITDTRIGSIALAVNLGYRWRESGGRLGDSQIEPTKDQLIGSIGTSYLLPYVDTKLIVEAFGSRPIGKDIDTNGRRQASSAELLGGIKHNYTTNLALHAGASTELINGAASPDWRIYGGVMYVTGPHFSNTNTVMLARKTKPAKRPYDEIEEITLYINFEFNSDKLDKASMKIIDDLVKLVKKKGSFKILMVEGHTDSLGSAQYNQQLSQRRADSVRKILVDEYKFSAKLVEAIGFGEVRPIADNGNYQGREKNRRVEIRIIR